MDYTTLNKCTLIKLKVIYLDDEWKIQISEYISSQHRKKNRTIKNSHKKTHFIYKQSHNHKTTWLM